MNSALKVIQVRKYLSGRNGIFAFSLLLLLALGACSAKKERPVAKPPVHVMAANAVRKNVPVQIRVIGNVEPSVFTP
jgi:multidrug efflux system membrane fusion protein